MKEIAHVVTFFHEIKNSITLKVAIIGVTILAMIIPSATIFSLIRERQERKNSVVDEISSKWGKSQMIGGPVISFPYRYIVKDKDGKQIESIRYEHFLPEELIIKVSINPEIRYRGIFEVVLYNADIEMEGFFKSPQLSESTSGKAFLSLGISDMRGIKKEIETKFNGKPLNFIPGIDCDDLISNGVSSLIDLTNKESGNIPFTIKLNINGSGEINFIPIGRTTTLDMNSKWKSPSFDGAFLPSTRTVDDNGFTAKWKILELNRNFPQSWKGKKYVIDECAFGTKLIIEANIYQQATRTAKYAMLFVIFTFTSVLISEFLTKVRIHPLQYLLIGLAVLMFYCLLLACSEHIGFGKSYLISAILVFLLVTLYSKAAFSRTTLAITIGGVLALLYTYFYIILQLEDYALLMGAIGLFLILAVVMFMTRKINASRS